MVCKHCGAETLSRKLVTFKDGTRHVEERCTTCGKFQHYVAQNKPAEQFIMPYGKYKGVSLGEILRADRDYAVWAAANLASPKVRLKFREMLKNVEG